MKNKDGLERQRFERDLKPHVAALMGFARPYVGRLSKRDRTYFFTRALEVAFERREQFNPRNGSLLQWWDGCLRAVARTRKTWQEWHMDHWETVRAEDLGRTD